GAICNTVAAVVIDAQSLSVENPKIAILIDQAARVVHLGEYRDFIDLAVAVFIDAAHNLAAAGRTANRALLIDCDEEHAIRGGGQCYGIVHFGWGSKQ